MNTVKRASKLLKAFADSTRLRIVNLLWRQELNVNQLCMILDKKQSIMSKHLAQLRMLDIVADKKDGLHVSYYLPEIKDKEYNQLLNALTEGFYNLELIRKDASNLNKLKFEDKDKSKP